MRMLFGSGAQFSKVASKQSADLWTHAGISTSHTLQTGARSSYFDWSICCSKEETGMNATRKLIRNDLDKLCLGERRATRRSPLWLRRCSR